MLNLIALSLALASAPSQEAAVGVQEVRLQDEVTQSGRTGDRKARRIIRTTSGSILRGVTRRAEGGGWQVKAKRGWVDVPDLAVERIALESELLKELEGREADPEGKPADTLEWAFEVGLLKEAFSLGDRLLVDSPRDADVRLVCARAGRFVAGMPDRGDDGELDALRKLGSQGSPIVREAIVERLLLAAPRAELLAALQEDLKSKLSGRRAFAMQALGRLFPGEDPRVLLLHAMWDPSPAARVEAARAVAEIGAVEVGAPLVRALGSEKAQVRIRAAEALGHARADAFVEPLMDRLLMLSAPAAAAGGANRPPHAYIFVGTQSAYVQDFDVEVAQRAAVADPVINTLLQGAVLDVGVIGVEITMVRQERRAIQGALQRITGQRPGARASDWIQWWEGSDDASRFRRPAAAPDSIPDASDGKRRSRPPIR